MDEVCGYSCIKAVSLQRGETFRGISDVTCLPGAILLFIVVVLFAKVTLNVQQSFQLLNKTIICQFFINEAHT